MFVSHKIQYSWRNWRDVVFLSFVHSLWTKILNISYNSTISQFPSTSMQSSVDSSRSTQKKCRRTRNTNIQRTFHFSFGRSCRQYPNQSIGWVATSNNTHIEFVAAVKCTSECVGMGMSSWKFRLQSNANRTYGMCSAIPYQAKSTQDIRRAFRRRFLSQKSPEHYRTHFFCQKEKSKEACRHSVLQTQVHHTANGHSSRQVQGCYLHNACL